MKIIVMSDNHGDTYYMEEILSIHEEDTDGWFHCGDSELPATHPLFQSYLTVRGNMDFTKDLKLTRLEEIQGEKFYLAHGHKHHVKRSYDALAGEARELGSRFVLYGHTHIPKVDKEHGIYFINPGSITQPRNRRYGTYLVMEFTEDKSSVALTYYDQDHNKVTDLSQTLFLS